MKNAKEFRYCRKSMCVLLLPVVLDRYEPIPNDFSQSLDKTHKAIKKGASGSTLAASC